LNVLSAVPGAKERFSTLRAAPSRPLLSFIPWTLLEKIDSALFLASGDLNPSFLNVLFALAPGITVLG
jgi:hypothetical protein